MPRRDRCRRAQLRMFQQEGQDSVNTLRRLALLLIALLPLAVATACGSSPDSDSGAAGSPQRIISLSPSATETLWAIGAGRSEERRVGKEWRSRLSSQHYSTKEDIG